ncbi:hypothetical protein ACO0K2_18540 [Undibacterium sp. MH2W]|uniref:hypothetical protein n=1 Tax=Undibacterium sp. MH2W TaxID=3413044 RepID=UPI003BF0B8D5
MKRKEILEQINVFVGAANIEDAVLVERLQNAGVALSTAERLISLLPIAFGRVVIEKLAQVTFSNNFIVRETNQELPLSDEEIYIEALSLANECYQSGVIQREEFSDIAIRSPELAAVNKALNEGNSINGANFAPVVLWGYKTIGKKSCLERIFS